MTWQWLLPPPTLQGRLPNQTANMPVACAGRSQLLAGLAVLELRLRVHGLTVTHSNMFLCLLVMRRAELFELTRQPCRTKACRVCHTVCKQRPKAVHNAPQVENDKLCRDSTLGGTKRPQGLLGGRWAEGSAPGLFRPGLVPP
jgi:hypothetical protein